MCYDTEITVGTEGRHAPSTAQSTNRVPSDIDRHVTASPTTGAILPPLQRTQCRCLYRLRFFCRPRLETGEYRRRRSAAQIARLDFAFVRCDRGNFSAPDLCMGRENAWRVSRRTPSGKWRVRLEKSPENMLHVRCMTCRYLPTYWLTS